MCKYRINTEHWTYMYFRVFISKKNFHIIYNRDGINSKFFFFKWTTLMYLLCNSYPRRITIIVVYMVNLFLEVNSYKKLIFPYYHWLRIWKRFITCDFFLLHEYLQAFVKIKYNEVPIFSIACLHMLKI